MARKKGRHEGKEQYREAKGKIKVGKKGGKEN